MRKTYLRPVSSEVYLQTEGLIAVSPGEDALKIPVSDEGMGGDAACSETRQWDESF